VRGVSRGGGGERVVGAKLGGDGGWGGVGGEGLYKVNALAPYAAASMIGLYWAEP
jgi:hypothetical protein